MEEKKQAKIFELQNLIAQYNSGERVNIKAAEYPVWVQILNMLNQADIEENIFDDFLAHPSHYKIEDNKIVINTTFENKEK